MNTVSNPIVIIMHIPTEWKISGGIKSLIICENLREMLKTAAPMRVMTAADDIGILILLFRKATAIRYESMLMIKERKKLVFKRISSFREILFINMICF